VKILAAVVTHNRCVLLERCVEAIQQQTRMPDALVVINNASSDGTVEMLDARDVAHIDQANLGSAGGWNRAIAACLDQEFDAVWLMDDDGYPDAQALEALERALVPGRACVSSVVLREDEPSHFVFPFPILDRVGLPVVLARTRKLPTLAQLAEIAPDGTYPFAHLFNGALIARSAIEAAGSVDARFFMFGDEVDYFFRLRCAGEVRSILAACHYAGEAVLLSQEHAGAEPALFQQRAAARRAHRRRRPCALRLAQWRGRARQHAARPSSRRGAARLDSRRARTDRAGLRCLNIAC
jgi:rhamnopyranosyl-N-acetylglucosaminyl-diphospho-decaprenol beta-1,3/1,4-galactofuranosyltransferase